MTRSVPVGGGKPVPFEGPFHCANCGKMTMRIEAVLRNFNNGLSACCADNLYPWHPRAPEREKAKMLDALAGLVTEEGNPLPFSHHAPGQGA